MLYHWPVVHFQRLLNIFILLWWMFSRTSSKCRILIILNSFFLFHLSIYQLSGDDSLRKDCYSIDNRVVWDIKRMEITRQSSDIVPNWASVSAVTKTDCCLKDIGNLTVLASYRWSQSGHKGHQAYSFNKGNKFRTCLIKFNIKKKNQLQMHCQWRSKHSSIYTSHDVDVQRMLCASSIRISLSMKKLSILFVLSWTIVELRILRSIQLNKFDV